MPGVLVVDDEELIRFSFSRALRKEGFAVADAESGKEAIDKIGRGSYDLAIIDLHLGDINGLDVIRHLRKVSPETKVIVITAYSTDELRSQILREGVNGIYEKPFDTYDVVSAILQYLSSGRLGTAIERRSAERKSYNKPVSFTLLVLEHDTMKSLELNGIGVDISRTGMCVGTEYPLCPGHILEFNNGMGLKTGIVAWSRVMPDNSYRAGVRFIEDYS